MKVRFANGSIRPLRRDGVEGAKDGNERSAERGWPRDGVESVDDVGDGVAHPSESGEALLDVGQSLRWSDGGARLLEGFEIGDFGAVHG